MVGLGRVYLWDQRQWWKSLILGPAWGVGGGLEDSMSGGRVTVVGVRSGMGCRVLSGDISKGSWPVSAPSHWPDLRELGAKLGEFLMEDRRCRKVQEGIQYKNRETCVCVWVWECDCESVCECVCVCVCECVRVGRVGRHLFSRKSRM